MLTIINFINNLGFMKTFPFRYINSLYYDTPELFSVTENLDGISSRNKYRIRWYYNDEKIKFGLRILFVLTLLYPFSVIICDILLYPRPLFSFMNLINLYNFCWYFL